MSFQFQNVWCLPEAPIGWPRDIAPPLMFTLSVFSPSSLTQAKDCAANASFSSNRSTSSNFHPAFDTYFNITTTHYLITENIIFWILYAFMQSVFLKRMKLTAVWTAVMGPVPIISGFTPVQAEDTILPRGVKPLFLASSSVIITTAAAPSLIEEEFPAVTLPVPS